MSSDRVPSRTEVMGWSPAQLAAHLKKMNLTGCDKVVMKNSISGSRFVNLSENDLQKFPKLHAPLISKISTEISKKEERRGLFGNRITSKYHEPAETSSDFQGGWDPDEFDDEDCDDDYESPYSGEEEGSGGDYESPNEGEYEPNPTEPPEDLPHARLPISLPEGFYIDRDPPPAVCPRPTADSLTVPEPRLPGMSSSRRDASPSPHSGGRPPGSFPVAPPQISRENKPGRVSVSTPSPVRGPQPSMPSAHSWRQKPDTPDPNSWTKPPVPTPTSSSIGRSNSNARYQLGRFDASRELASDDVHKNNTFPLQNKSLPPRPGLPGPPSRHGDSLPPNIPSAGSLPHKFSSGMGDHGGSFSGSARQSFRPPPPASTRTPELDPLWYVGKVTRGRAEECLKRVNKDGAYLVRDSARQLADQPFTLMVLYQDKVFNIQIRQQNQNFLLGTGLKAQESFPSVSDIISHYSQSPLLLIDAKNRRSPQQNQCLLSDPAGFCMTTQGWS